MKAAVKALASTLATVLVLPVFFCYRLAGLALGPDRVFPGYSQALSLLPGIAGAYLRRAFYSMVLPRCGPDCWISFGVIFSHNTAEVGRFTYIGPYCCLGNVTVEDDVLLGSHVSVANGNAQHGIDRLDVPIREQPGTWPRVTIGQDSWIGDRTVVLADVGRHCVIGAGSVVTRPVQDYAIVMGVPARVVRWRKAPDMPSPSTPERSTPVQGEIQP